MRARRDRYNPLGDPFEELAKHQEDKAKQKERDKKRLKGTGHVDRSYHRKMEDL